MLSLLLFFLVPRQCSGGAWGFSQSSSGTVNHQGMITFLSIQFTLMWQVKIATAWVTRCPADEGCGGFSPAPLGQHFHEEFFFFDVLLNWTQPLEVHVAVIALGASRLLAFAQPQGGNWGEEIPLSAVSAGKQQLPADGNGSSDARAEHLTHCRGERTRKNGIRFGFSLLSVT